MIDLWNVDPFAGPSETSFPYANQILDLTNAFIVPGSCPAENPTYPSPRQNLPPFTAAIGTKSIKPGSHVKFNFTDPIEQPSFEHDQSYHAVFFHSLYNISVPFDTQTNTTTIPAAFEDLGVILAVIAKEEGAPTKESVVAGPAILLEQPANVGLELASY